MYYIFIDTNVWLSVYSEKNPLSHLVFTKLERIIEKSKNTQKEIKLLLNDCVFNEFHRNRSKIIQRTFERLKQERKTFEENISKIKQSVPAFIYNEFDEIITETQKINSIFKQNIVNIENIMTKYTDKQLKFVDIKDIFFPIDDSDKYEIEKIDNSLINEAFLKAEIGWGPGKESGSIGDQINWNWLLKKIPDNKDVRLYIVTHDGDYFEFKNDDKKLNFRLEKEWKKEKENASIHLYRNLKKCLNDLEKIIEEGMIASKKEAIANFGSSISFSDTHFLIDEIKKYIDHFNNDDIMDILGFFVENKQIHWLTRDPDVRAFFGNIFKRYIEKNINFYYGKDNYINFLKFIYLMNELERSLYFYDFEELCMNKDWSYISDEELFEKVKSFFDLFATKNDFEYEDNESELNDEEESF